MWSLDRFSLLCLKFRDAFVFTPTKAISQMLLILTLIISLAVNITHLCNDPFIYPSLKPKLWALSLNPLSPSVFS